MGALFVLDERGTLSRTAFILFIFGIRTPLLKVGCGGSRYEVICTFREKSHSRQPCGSATSRGWRGQVWSNLVGFHKNE